METENELSEEERQALKIGTIVLSLLGVIFLVVVLYLGIKIGRDGEEGQEENGEVAGEEDTILSEIIIASSTTIPSTTTSPNIDMLLIVIFSHGSKINVTPIDTGMPTAVHNAILLSRNKNKTVKTSIKPNTAFVYKIKRRF